VEGEIFYISIIIREGITNQIFSRDGKYGLYLDDRFERGISNSCPAFGNEPLSECGIKFDIVGVEVWRISSA
jgi:hypothetical protein